MAENLDRVSLTTAVTSLRKQIKEAAEQAQGLSKDEVRFRITSAELELTVVAEDSGTVGGEVGWWIFKARADVSAKDAVTHKIKLSLDIGDIEVGSHKHTA